METPIERLRPDLREGGPYRHEARIL